MGTPVTASSLLGQKIIGHYRGPSGSLGVFVLGVVIGGDPNPQLHKCSRVSMELNLPPQSKKPKGKFRANIGQLCQGLTTEGEMIIGEYQQAAGPHLVYLRGCLSKFWPPSPLEKKAYKVLRSTLKPLQP